MPVTLQGPGANPFTGTEDKPYWIRKMLIRATPKLLDLVFGEPCQ